MTPKTKRKKPWNKGKTVGGKTPLKPDEVQAIRVVLAGGKWPMRDRVLFAVGIDSCLRGHDLVRLTVADLMLAGEPRERVTLKPSKTKATSGEDVTFRLQPDTRELLVRYVTEERLLQTDYLFGRTKPQAGTPRTPMTERAYAMRVDRWVAAIGLPVELYGTHSIRKVLPTHVYKNTGDIRTCQLMLGHSNVRTTQTYLGIEMEDAMDVAQRWWV